MNASSSNSSISSSEDEHDYRQILENIISKVRCETVDNMPVKKVNLGKFSDDYHWKDNNDAPQPSKSKEASINGENGEPNSERLNNEEKVAFTFAEQNIGDDNIIRNDGGVLIGLIDGDLDNLGESDLLDNISPRRKITFEDEAITNENNLSTERVESPSKMNNDLSNTPSSGADESTNYKELHLRRYTENEIRETFRLLDIKGNNFLSIEDIKSAYKTMGKELTTEDCNMIIETISSNADGIVRFEDFHEVMYSEFERGVTDEDLRYLFDIIDKNNDGYIEACDIQLLYRKCGAKLSVPETADILACYDDNFDGILSFQEFRNLFHDKIKDKGVIEVEELIEEEVS